MLRRLHPDQPDSFAFTPANLDWARAQMTKYPEGREASAVIPLLWRAQEQEGWLSRPAIEYVAELLGMAHIRALEVATFYFMFQLQPVGSVAHVQVCGTTPCMLCGAEDLVGVCRDKIAVNPHQLSPDGRFSWEEVECLGACANAPMAQIGKDYFEDLTAEGLASLLDRIAAGDVPAPGSQTGRFASEPLGGATALAALQGAGDDCNASVRLAADHGDTLARIDGSEAPVHTPWRRAAQADPDARVAARDPLLSPQGPDGAQGGRPVGDAPAPRGIGDASDKVSEAPGEAAGIAAPGRPDADKTAAARPAGLDAPRDGAADDLKRIRGVGPALEAQLHALGIYHFDQVAGWGLAEMAWMDDNLDGVRGRVSRDDWVGQARDLKARAR